MRQRRCSKAALPPELIMNIECANPSSYCPYFGFRGSRYRRDGSKADGYSHIAFGSGSLAMIGFTFGRCRSGSQVSNL